VSAATGPGKAATANVVSVARPHAPTNIKLSGQNGQLMLKSDKLELERGAATKTENQDR
jgi:hypothetical protein